MEFVYGIALLWMAFQALTSLIGSDLLSSRSVIRYRKWKIYKSKHGGYSAKYISFKLWYIIPIYVWYRKEECGSGNYSCRVVVRQTMKDLILELEEDYRRNRPIEVERVK